MKSTKICTKCKVRKPARDYPKSATSQDGTENRCKKCKTQYQRQWRANNANRPTTPRRRIKPESEVDAQPFDPELEQRRHVKNLVAQFGIEGAKVKIKLEAFAS